MPAYVFFYLFPLVEISNKQANKSVFSLCISGPQRLFRGLTKFGGLGYNILEPEKKNQCFCLLRREQEGKSIVRITRLHTGWTHLMSTLQHIRLSWGCSSVVECLPHMCEGLVVWLVDHMCWLITVFVLYQTVKLNPLVVCKEHPVTDEILTFPLSVIHLLLQ